MLDFLRSLRGLPPGEQLDAVRRKVILRAWRAREEVSVRCAGQTARLRSRRRSTDAEVIWQCFVGRQYEVPKLTASPHHAVAQAAYVRMKQAGQTPLIVDCGANMGASVTWFDMRYPGSRIVAVEPAAANVELLRANCGRLANVAVVEAGVGPQDGEAFLQHGDGSFWGFKTGAAPSGKPVRIVSLAGLIEANLGPSVAPFILKIDIEGAERRLFDHSLDVIGRFPIIIFEPHDFYMPAERTASPFFRFHADAGRDFLFHYENVFSLDMVALREGASA